MVNSNFLDTKLKDLLKFPCLFTYKVIGDAKPELINLISNVIKCYVSGNYTTTIKPSTKGNYYAVSIRIVAASIEQIENLYKDFSEISIVRIVL
ncbi:DUF493 family protein YbeD [Candidatus Photodesmus anomalopis]|uniref:UPF0250 protein O1U_0676 n=1 Tax=Candidatus Photodesmus katoptron Akat1 TaxID=1236703 RepID=S3DZL5_9GAMM|nr:DUF493 family protein YbeD [Candidatus Photodesmus katoptron]EPE37376.1 hypothetical protein O1U_0676 [Candidatus Photodesmus katoptron Akat1]